MTGLLLTVYTRHLNVYKQTDQSLVHVTKLLFMQLDNV